MQTQSSHSSFMWTRLICMWFDYMHRLCSALSFWSGNAWRWRKVCGRTWLRSERGSATRLECQWAVMMSQKHIPNAIKGAIVEAKKKEKLEEKVSSLWRFCFSHQKSKFTPACLAESHYSFWGGNAVKGFYPGLPTASFMFIINCNCGPWLCPLIWLENVLNVRGRLIVDLLNEAVCVSLHTAILGTSFISLCFAKTNSQQETFPQGCEETFFQ